MSEQNDKELLQQLKDPSSRNYGFNILIRKYQERIYYHVRRMVVEHEDANDITQDVFIKVWNHIDSFREDASIYTWIYRIATNESISFLRKKKRRFMLPINDVEQELMDSLESDPYFEGDEAAKKLQKAILTLPEKQRIIFNMRYFDELKYEEISEVLETSVGALKASYHHAVKKIEKYLMDD